MNSEIPLFYLLLVCLQTEEGIIFKEKNIAHLIFASHRIPFPLCFAPRELLICTVAKTKNDKKIDNKIVL